jgi:hypothetical protein
MDFVHPAIAKSGSYAIPTNAWQCDVGLDYLTTYYWRVRAVSQSTIGAWSATGIFTTGPELKGVPDNGTVRLLSGDDALTVHGSSPASVTAPLPVISDSPAVRPAPSSSPPLHVSALPAFTQTVGLPAWVIYLIFGLLAVLALALCIILSFVLKIKRF